MSNILPAGTPAPDFTLHATPEQTLTLNGLRGRPVILAFYPADWSPVCGDLNEQMLGELVQRLRLDSQALTEALGSGAFAERVRKDFSGGVRSGVNGTPTFFINGQRHDGDFEVETLRQAINKAAGK